MISDKITVLQDKAGSGKTLALKQWVAEISKNQNKKVIVLDCSTSFDWKKTTEYLFRNVDEALEFMSQIEARSSYEEWYFICDDIGCLTLGRIRYLLSSLIGYDYLSLFKQVIFVSNTIEWRSVEGLLSAKKINVEEFNTLFERNTLAKTRDKQFENQKYTLKFGRGKVVDRNERALRIFVSVLLMACLASLGVTMYVLLMKYVLEYVIIAGVITTILLIGTAYSIVQTFW